MKRHTKTLSVLLAVILCFSFIIPAFSVFADKREVIRVGFPIFERLTQIDENGKYSGYTYEYLQEIAQYTGWEYEFVKLDGDENDVLSKMYEMLKNGELDIMGSTNYSLELDNDYDFPNMSYGAVNYTLEALEDNTFMNDLNYHKSDNLRIAVLEKAKTSQAALADFCNENNFNYTLIYCKNEDELKKTLDEKKADVMLYNDISLIKGTRIVSKFKPKPFYFATTNGNTDVVSKLNSAMKMINSGSPYFTEALHQKYFSKKSNLLTFTENEQAFIKKSKVLTVAVPKSRYPLEKIDLDGSASGISIDVLDIISEKTGIKFQYKPIDSLEEIHNALKNRTVDLAVGVTYDYNDSQNYNFSMTNSYISTQISMISKEKINPYELENKRLALPFGVNYEGIDGENAIRFNSNLECVNAIKSGKADYTYGNNYSMEYYSQTEKLSHLTLVPQTSHIYNYCIGISRPVDPILISVLNKTIDSISKDEIETIIYKNSIHKNEKISIEDFIRSHPIEVVFILLSFGLLLVAFLVYFAWSQKHARMKLQIENERFNLLCDLSLEYLFEYDYKKDVLTLTEKTVEAFGGKLITEKYLENVLKSSHSKDDWARNIQKSLDKDKSIITERQVEIKTGELIWMRIAIAVITDESGNKKYLVGKITNIQSEKEEKDELLKQSKTDSLTKLCNVTTTREQTEKQLLENVDIIKGSIFILDIDFFKKVNDNYGHYIGDKILQDVSTVLRNVFTMQDIIGRIGGDEFIVFSQVVKNEKDIKEKINLINEQVFKMDSRWPTSITLSIGIAIAKKGATYDSLYKSADLALYKVKENGRNGFLIAKAKSDNK
ncbi:MAG: transporter substrate-binding domain-containing protein [Clostridia bacterium]